MKILMTSLESILGLAKFNAISLVELERFSQERGVPLVQACDQIALHIAQEYWEGKISYEAGDRVMNSLFSAVTTEAFFSRSDREIPPLVLSVYQAFDEGEYIHPDDSPEDNQERKYTKPMIAVILSSYRAASHETPPK